MAQKTKAELEAAAAKAKAAADAKVKATLDAKKKALTDLKGRVEYKTGANTAKPVTSEVAQANLDAANKLQTEANTALAASKEAANAVTNFKPELTSDTQDAFAQLKIVFTELGLGDLSDTITRLMAQGETASGALVKLKYDKSIDPATNKPWNAAYSTRFAGNATRISNGMNALSEAAYITLENSYTETLKAYGLGNMLSTDRAVNAAKFAKYIGNDISAPEFKDRIATAEDRVINADPATKELFKAWYPNVTDSDLVSYFLDPTETIGKLKEKATAAEIGAAAKQQGLSATEINARGLAAYGIDRSMALQGYANIAEVLPSAKNLSSIYKEAGIDYSQATGEAEFMKGNAEAAEKRKRLKSLERAQFSGESGIGSGSLTRTTQGSF